MKSLSKCCFLIHKLRPAHIKPPQSGPLMDEHSSVVERAFLADRGAILDRKSASLPRRLQVFEFPEMTGPGGQPSLRQRLSVPTPSDILTEENELLRLGGLGFLGFLGGMGFLCALCSCVGIRNDAESESGEEQQSEQAAHKISMSRIIPSP